MITIECKICHSIIVSEHVVQALKESDFHMASAHPKEKA